MPSSTSILSENINQDLLDKQITVTISDQAQKSIYEKSFLLKNPYDFDWDPFASTDEPLNLTTFLELVGDLLENQQVRDGTKEDKRIKLIADYPDARVSEHGDAVITSRVISRKPAALGADNKQFVHRGWQHYYEVTIPEIPKHRLIVERRLVAHTIEFSVWSKSARLANEKALWLENTLINSSYLFLSRGAERFYWEGRLADTYMNVSGQPLYQRPLRFFVTLNSYRIKAEPLISDFEIKIEVEEAILLTHLQGILLKKIIHSEE